MCWVSTTFALVSHGRCRAVRPNWAILGSMGSAILWCCNVGRATVATATQWPNSSRHCLFYALARHVPALPTHPMRLGRCGTVCRRSQGCHGHSECAQGRLRPQKCRKVARGCAPSNPAPKGGHPPLETPPCPTVLAASAAERVATFLVTFTECAWKRWAFSALSSFS